MDFYRIFALLGVFVILGCESQTITADDTDARMADIQTMYRRQVDFLTGQIGNTAGPRCEAAVERMDQGVENLLATDWPGATFTEADRKNIEDLQIRNIVNQSQYTRAVSSHLGNLSTLAAAYHVPGSRYYKNEELQARVMAELKRALPWVKPDSPKPGYWSSWYFTISKALAETALLVDDYIDPATRKLLVDSLNYQMQDLTLSGVNAVWEGRNHFMFALLMRDAEKIDKIMSRIEPQLQYRDESGVMEDYSYQFHGRLVYTGAYGAGYSQAVSQFLFFTDGTEWEIPQEKREVMINYLLHHAQWTSIGGAYDISVSGRSYHSRRSSLSLTEALIYMSFVNSDRQQLIRQAAARMLSEHTNLPITIAPMADEITTDAAQPLQGFRYYHTSDYAIFRNENFFTSVRMLSRLMQDYEYLGYGGGIEGYNLSNGFTYITRNGREWYGPSNAIDKLNYDRMPGTTTRYTAKPPTPFNFGESNFSGGAGFDNAGILAFKSIPPAGDLTAQKSYFFFDQGFVAMGSAIQSTAEHDQPIITTINQWATPDQNPAIHISSSDESLEDNSLQSDISLNSITWAWCDNVGYVFPKPVTLHINKDDFLVTFWLDHGHDPQNAEYAYIVLPDISLEATKQFAANPPIQILELTENIHSVCDTSTMDAATVFWQAGTSGLVTVDHPAIVYQQPQENGINFTVQNPLHSKRKINLLIDHAGPVTAFPPEVNFTTKNNETLLNINTAMGRQYRIALGNPDKPLTQVPREDLAEFYDFKVSAESDDTVTYLTVHLPQEVLATGYRLTVHGHQSHYLHEMTEDDIVERIDDQTIKFKFDRFATGNRQTFGGFRMQIHTPLKGATAYFTVPRYDEKDEDLGGRDYFRDTNRPPHENGPAMGKPLTSPNSNNPISKDLEMKFRRQIIDDAPPGTELDIVLIGDINGNGKPDIVIGGKFGDANLFWYENPSWQRHIIAVSPQLEAGGVLLDINGNGRLDIVAGMQINGNELYWFENPQDPTKPWPKHIIENRFKKYHDQVIGDLNNDGKQQILISSQQSGIIAYYDIPDDPTVEPWPQECCHIVARDLHNIEGLAIVDIDGDGVKEIIAGTNIFRRPDNPGDLWHRTALADDYTMTRVQIADLDGDGQLEIVLAEGESNPGRLSICRAPDYKPVVLMDDLFHPHSLEIADFNGNGRPDIFVGEMSLGRNPHPPRMIIMENKGNGQFEPVTIAEGYANHESKVADLTGNGKPDIVVKPYMPDNRVEIWFNEN